MQIYYLNGLQKQKKITKITMRMNTRSYLDRNMRVRELQNNLMNEYFIKMLLITILVVVLQAVEFNKELEFMSISMKIEDIEFI